METEQRRYVATTVNTDDKDAEQRYYTFLEKIFPAAQAAEQQIKQKLLSSELEPPAFDVPLRNMRVQARMFREANLPLRTEEQKLATEYDKIAGAQTVEWEGRELTLQQLHPVYQNTDRTLRERAWRLEQARRLQDQAALDALWVKLLQLRLQIAANADFPDYRAYRWQQLQRVDYTPADCVAFHQAVEQVAVPAATRIYERRRQRLGLETLRPWDLDVNSLGLAPLRPFTEVADLEARSAAILRRVDPELGAQFEIMRREGLLDLDNRVGKAPGGYCTVFPAAERPFIFMNAVGLHNDVVTLLHESGHAFHVFHIFGAGRLPYYQQWDVGMEFAEVVSMAMELLGAPYLPADEGGFYSVQEAARAYRAPRGRDYLVAAHGRGRCVPALGIRASRCRGRSRALPGVLGLSQPALRAKCRLERARSCGGKCLAADPAYLPAAVLFYRVRHGAARRGADLAQRPARSGQRGGALSQGACAGRHRRAAAAL